MNSIQNIYNVATPVPYFLECHICSIQSVLCNNKTEVEKWGEEQSEEKNEPSKSKNTICHTPA